jgi:hypothetical protein
MVTKRNPPAGGSCRDRWVRAATISNPVAYYVCRVSQAPIVSEVYRAPIDIRGGDYSK